jgi:DNA-binding transcriptional regulator YiaG
MFTIERWMVKPLRDKLMMTRESLAYILNCGTSTLRNYERVEGDRMKQSVRRGMDRLMVKNGITVEDLGGDGD